MATLRHQIMTIYAAAQRYGIRPQDLYGVYGVETSYGRNVNTSSAGAVGPFQFLPGTAHGLGVNPYNFTSAAFGAAKYLSQLGYSKDRLRALGAYNGGPGNPQYGYANQVVAAGRSLPRNPAGAVPAPARGKAPAGTAGTPAQTIVTGTTPVLPGGTPKADELTAQQQTTPGQVPVTTPPEPAYSASRFMAPIGGPLKLTPPLAGGVTPPSTPSLDQQLADVGKQQGPDLGSLTTQTIPGTGEQVAPTGTRTGRQVPARGRFAGSYTLDSGAGRQPRGPVQAGLKFIGASLRTRIEVGTTTNHGPTIYGTPSWHQTGQAADILVGGRDTHLGDRIATAALVYAGVPYARAKQMARQGGEWDLEHGGRHFQILWRTYIGGDHHNHVHFGVK